MNNGKSLMKICVMVVFSMLIFSFSALPEPGIEGRPQVVLDGSIATVSVDVAGGSIVDFHLKDQGLNPLTWNYPEKGDLAPRTMGHFLCFDRWGQPSKQELQNGMPFHGEAAKILWRVLSRPEKKDGSVNAQMQCVLPMGGLQLKRTLSLFDNDPVMIVREEITNLNKLGRVYNIVQHATVAPPFLDETVLVDANVKKGYMQESRMPNPENPVIYWSKIAYRGELVDLRRLFDNARPGVVSYVFDRDEEYGWVTICNPKKELLLGYIWKLSEYPWLNLWRNVRRGIPAARGLEFGTTGLHRPFNDTLKKGKIFDTPIYEYIDAGQTIEKSYVVFLTKIPADYNGVAELYYHERTISLKEMEGKRDITINF
ncbi:hypothetical protein ACFL1R_12290 [Candidatus Latescibacterota bacterium]